MTPKLTQKEVNEFYRVLRQQFTPEEIKDAERVVLVVGELKEGDIFQPL